MIRSLGITIKQQGAREKKSVVQNKDFCGQLADCRVLEKYRSECLGDRSYEFSSEGCLVGV